MLRRQCSPSPQGLGSGGGWTLEQKLFEAEQLPQCSRDCGSAPGVWGRRWLSPLLPLLVGRLLIYAALRASRIIGN